MNEADSTIETVETTTTNLGGATNHTMSLSECGAYDMENHARENLTGWGKICKDRCENRKSKRGEARRARKG